MTTKNLSQFFDDRDERDKLRGGRPPWEEPGPSSYKYEKKLYLREESSAEVPITGTLYVRPARLGMPTICPASMSWLLYLKVVRTLFPKFQFKIKDIEDKDGVPRFVTEQDSYEDLDIFARTEFTLEPKRTNELNIQRQRKEEDTLNSIDRRKQNMKEHLINLENAFLYGCSLLELQEEEWIKHILEERIGISDDKQRLEQMLLKNMEIACRNLSDLLGHSCYFNDDLRETFTYTTSFWGKGCGIATMTMIDVKVAAICMLIMKSFDNTAEVPYNSTLKYHLNRHTALWALGERLYSFYMQPKVKDYSDVTKNTPLIAEIQQNLPQGSGQFGLVYKVKLDLINDWDLPPGYYAFKISKQSTGTGNFMAEICNLGSLPYTCVTTLFGYGQFKQDTYEHDFIITNWIDGGDLESKLNDLDWDQAIRILKTLAYALYMVYKPGKTCVCDLKPANILLDKTDSSILCDMGLAINEGAKVSLEWGTQSYLDGSEHATHERDVFAFGITLFQMFTDKFIKETRGVVFSKEMREVIKAEERLEVLVKKRLKDTGCSPVISRKIILLGAECIRPDKETVALGAPSTDTRGGGE